MAVYTETVKLDDQISKAAADAANEAKVLDSAIRSVQNSLIKAQATGNIAGFKKASTQLDMLKIASGQANQKVADFDKQIASAGPKVSEFAGSADKASGGLAGFQEELAAATGGLSAVLEVMGAVAVGFGALTLAGAAFAIKASEAKDASISLFNALGAGRIKGEEVDDMLDGLRSTTGLTKDSLAPLTTEFLKMGITGKNALEGLTVAAASADAMAKGGADAFTKLWQQANAAAETGSKLTIPYKKLQSQLVATGLNVDDLAKEMNLTSKQLTDGLAKGTISAAKFGDALETAVTKKGVGPLETLANSSANLGGLLKEYIGDMFEDLGKDIAPFMKEVRSLFNIFDSKSKPSGEALKQGIGGFFKQVFAAATKVVPMVKHFLLDVIIYGLKAYIALKPIISWFKQMSENKTVLATLTYLFNGMKLALGVVAVVIGVVVAAFAALLAINIVVVSAFWALMAAITDFTANVGLTLRDWAKGAYQYAVDFINGLVQGISNGAGMVVDAVKNLGNSAVNSFKSTLGINSPSKVMMTQGEFTGEGVAQGIQNKSQDVAAAASDLGGASVGGFAAGASGGSPSGGATGSGGGMQLTFEAGAIVIQGGSQDSIVDLTEQAIAIIFERVALARGL